MSKKKYDSSKMEMACMFFITVGKIPLVPPFKKGEDRGLFLRKGKIGISGG